MNEEANRGSARDLSVGEVALGSLVDEAHTMHPDDVVGVLRRKAATIGLNDVAIYLVDKEQRALRPLVTDGPVLSVDGSLAGRAYQRSETLVAEHGDRVRQVWFPILDGTARLGVMGARVENPDGVVLVRGRQLAGLVAYLLVAKAAYGDSIVNTSNAKPLSVSAAMRWAAVPPLAFEHGPVTLGAILEPAYDIAGDTFDYAIDRDTLHLGIFDAMGHGLRATQLANLAVFAYRTARRAGETLEEIYRSIDEIVASEFGAESFVTAQLVTIDLSSGAVDCINAGHPRPLLVRDQNVSEVAFDACLPIGLAHGEAELTRTVLQPGDTVVYLSDGMTEGRDEHGEQFGIERLGDHLFRAQAAGLTPPETLRRTAHAVLEHQGGQLADDATLVAVHWTGRPIT